MSYAETTSVPVDRTRAEIEALLQKAGAAQHGSQLDYEKNVARVAFVMKGAHYRITLPLPAYVEARQYNKTAAARRRYEQATRSAWRVLLLLIKAKIEAVARGVTSYEKEFLADMVLDNGRTVAEELPRLFAAGLPQLTTGER